MHKILAAASLLSSDFTKFDDTAMFFEEIGVDILHLDVMDGNFVPPLTFGAAMARDLKKNASIPLDAHLMVINPDVQVPQFIKAGVDSITIHVESPGYSKNLLKDIKSASIRAAIALNPSTPIVEILDILSDVDMVLLMSVNPGYGGQKFIPEVLHKIAKLKKLREKYSYKFDIQIDGGINENNIKDILLAGANIIVTGSALVNSKNPKDFILKLKGE